MNSRIWLVVVELGEVLASGGKVLNLVDLGDVYNNVTMLSIILAGAALIREREHGTVEHLLVMPVTPAEIMMAKVWSTALVVLIVAACSLKVVVQGALHVPIEGSVVLFLTITLVHLFATTSMGVFMATVARSMPQFGLLMMLTIMPLQMLSGGGHTAREYARVRAESDAAGTNHAFRFCGPGHSLPGSRPCHRVAATPGIDRHWRGVFCDCAAAIPIDYWPVGLRFRVIPTASQATKGEM
jgi:ABC-2 type transporter